jgi:hypothetical protein
VRRLGNRSPDAAFTLRGVVEDSTITFEFIRISVRDIQTTQHTVRRNASPGWRENESCAS